MEDMTIRRRNRLRHHYTITSNVLLFGYKHLSDAAKVTYQVIDSFDWSDSAGLRKGFAHPSLGRLAAIRGVDRRSIRRHLAQLETARLITREERPGRPSLLVIEDPSAGETQRYLATFAGRGSDSSVRPTPDKNVRPYKKEEREERQNIVNVDKSLLEQERGERRPYEHISHTIRELATSLKARSKGAPPEKAKREYLAQEMVRVLGDPHSLGCYRRIAERCPPPVIYEALGRVKEMAREGRIRKNRGALFAHLMLRFYVRGALCRTQRSPSDRACDVKRPRSLGLRTPKDTETMAPVRLAAMRAASFTR
jgi:DNA-binding transcriptional ArsR family regulator